MKIIRPMQINEFSPALDTTKHAVERSARISRYANLDHGIPAYVFLVDKAHQNGFEVHIITTDGFARIYNERTKLLITHKALREGQVLEYFSPTPKNDKVFNAIMMKARRNYISGFNDI